MLDGKCCLRKALNIEAVFADIEQVQKEKKPFTLR
jgi:hypothetical protein